MKYALPRNTVLFIGSKAVVNPVFAWENGAKAENQSIDPNTNLPIWNFDAEIISGEEVETVRIKIASATAPELKPRTEYKIIGESAVTPYLTKDKKLGISIMLRGTLEPTK